MAGRGDTAVHSVVPGLGSSVEGSVNQSLDDTGGGLTQCGVAGPENQPVGPPVSGAAVAVCVRDHGPVSHGGGRVLIEEGLEWQHVSKWIEWWWWLVYWPRHRDGVGGTGSLGVWGDGGDEAAELGLCHLQKGPGGGELSV